MKFDCGRSPEERRAERWARRERRYQWHRWFAWFPVRVDRRDCRWLENVERRREDAGMFYEWRYRALQPERVQQ